MIPPALSGPIRSGQGTLARCHTTAARHHRQTPPDVRYDPHLPDSLATPFPNQRRRLSCPFPTDRAALLPSVIVPPIQAP
jgi:hypothetical protein